MLFKFITDSIARRQGAPGRIQGLDGLRAVSIFLVVYDHFFRLGGSPLPPWSKWLCPFTGTTGVCIFFILSGYLITSLLLNEEDRRGRIDLSSFYIRRTLRIFPPFYVYLMLVAIAATALGVTWNSAAFAFSGTYLYNLSPQTDHLVGHTWSLSVEEQFYLCWPAVLVLFPRRAGWAAVLGIVFWPAVRYLRHGFVAYPTIDQAINVAALDTILYGALLAVLSRNKRSQPLLARLAKFPGLFPMTLVSLYALYFWKHTLSVEMCILLPIARNALITLLLWLVVSGSGRLTKALEWGPVVYLGMISYSLYLWQQPFWHFALGPEWPKSLSVAGALFMASLSYHLVECNCDKLKKRLHKWT